MRYHVRDIVARIGKTESQDWMLGKQTGNTCADNGVGGKVMKYFT